MTCPACQDTGVYGTGMDGCFCACAKGVQQQERWALFEMVFQQPHAGEGETG